MEHVLFRAKRKGRSCKYGVLACLLAVGGRPSQRLFDQIGQMAFCGKTSFLASFQLRHSMRSEASHEASLGLAALGGPVTMAPPPAIPTATSEPSWTECFLQAQGDSTQETLESEVWLFRSDTSAGFEKFLKHRHFGGDSGGDTATCRSVNPDSRIQCLECTRVIFGGVYGSIGVVVPAYPPESHAVGCLSRNRIVEADFDDDDNYDGNPTREVALCNSHRGHLDALPVPND